MDTTNHIEGAQALPSFDDDAYDVDVETAAQLLGVGTTRLSQITSRGSLSYQRRKVGFRNRMFYRRAELLAYLEQQFPNSAQFKSQALANRWAQEPERDISATEATAPPTLDLSPILSAIEQLQTQGRARPIVSKKNQKKLLPTALSLKEKEQFNAQFLAVANELQSFRALLARIEQKLDVMQKSDRAAARQPARTPLMPAALSSTSDAKKVLKPKWPRVHKNNAKK